MLCGIFPPTSGTASILGYDIATEMDKIRTRIGFCPQHDILYDDLNVEEHLKLIALVNAQLILFSILFINFVKLKIKGFDEKMIFDEIKRISSYVGLFSDLKTNSSGLSGGMKRRLSVAMALVGDSKIIILDEPTSGLV